MKTFVIGVVIDDESWMKLSSNKMVGESSSRRIILGTCPKEQRNALLSWAEDILDDPEEGVEVELQTIKSGSLITPSGVIRAVEVEGLPSQYDHPCFVTEITGSKTSEDAEKIYMWKDTLRVYITGSLFIEEKEGE